MQNPSHLRRRKPPIHRRQTTQSRRASSASSPPPQSPWHPSSASCPDALPRAKGPPPTLPLHLGLRRPDAISSLPTRECGNRPSFSLLPLPSAPFTVESSDDEGLPPSRRKVVWKPPIKYSEPRMGDSEEAKLEGSDVVFPTKIMNEHLICSLCMGYLRDAQTVTECLHTCGPPPSSPPLCSQLRILSSLLSPLSSSKEISTVPQHLLVEKLHSATDTFSLIHTHTHTHTHTHLHSFPWSR
jgi:hypothetical protein